MRRPSGASTIKDPIDAKSVGSFLFFGVSISVKAQDLEHKRIAQLHLREI
jgi:hypothetical protein